MTNRSALIGVLALIAAIVNLWGGNPQAAIVFCVIALLYIWKD